MSDRRAIRPYPAVSARPMGSDDRSRHDWELVLCGDFTDRQSDLMEQLVSVPRRSRGTIWFDSCGGSAYTGLALASTIRLRGLDPVAVVSGECSSAAILPFAACRRRFVTPHSTLLFHPLRWQSEENVRLEEAAEWTRHFRVMEEDLDRLIARLLDYPPEKLAAWNRPGRFVTGTELVEAGLARPLDLFGGDLWRQIAATD
ncbi:MAG: ClpP family protease [Maioricimonas sp. JB049]